MARSLVASDGFASFANFSQVNPDFGDMAATSGVVHGGSAFSPATGGMQAAVWSGAGTFSDDQYASLVVSNLDISESADKNIGVTVRSSADQNTNRDYYFVSACADSGTSTHQVYFGKIVNGTRTGFHNAAITIANGSRLELEAEGTTIRVMIDGVALGGSYTVTDSSLTTGKPGVCGAGAFATSARGDDWEAGDLVAGASNIYVAGTAQRNRRHSGRYM
jgi:hypothetical protein